MMAKSNIIDVEDHRGWARTDRRQTKEREMLAFEGIAELYGREAFDAARARNVWAVGKVVRGSDTFGTVDTHYIDGPHGVANIIVHDDDAAVAQMICDMLNEARVNFPAED